MKLNYKIFLLAFFLVVITEFTIGLLIIYFSHNNNVNLYIENCKKEHNNIRNIIFTETSKLQSYRDSSIDYNNSYIDNNKIMPQSIATVCYDIANNYKNNQMPTNIYLYVNDNLLYRNGFLFDNTLLSELTPNSDNLISYITSIGNEKRLFTSSQFTIEDTIYTFITTNNINEVYILKDKMVNFFILISMFFPFVVSFAIIAIIRIITRKIETLDSFAQNVSLGNYSQAPIFSGSDEISKLSYTLKDTFETININIKNLEEISDNRKMFISELMHEINTPISSMLLFSSIMNDKKNKLSSKKTNEYLEIINNRAIYISGIKDTLINVLMSNKEDKNFTYCNISEIIKKACKELNYYFKSKKIIINTNIQKNIILKTDPYLIQCLLENLIKNSSNSYTDGGEIFVSLTQNYLKVVDYGCGIPENELDNITRPFFYLSSDSSLKNMGIGLALCQEIARLHHGKLVIKNNISKKGVTSIFYFHSKEVDSNE